MDAKALPAFALTGMLLLLLAVATALSAQTASGYPLSIEPATPAKWERLYFSICINSQDPKHVHFVQQAIEKWKAVWPHFDYLIYEHKNTCNINMQITKYQVVSVRTE